MLWMTALIHPLLEGRDLVVRPFAVGWHVSSIQRAVDALGVRWHAHPCAIAQVNILRRVPVHAGDVSRPEHREDVVLVCQHECPIFSRTAKSRYNILLGKKYMFICD